MISHPPAPVLTLAGIGKDYRRRAVLRGLGLEVGRGEIVGLLGPNGSGKTTTLRIAAGYLWPDSGQVRLDGTHLTPDDAPLRARIGYLPERAPLYDPFTVAEYLRFVAAARGLARRARPAAVARVIEAFNLGSARKRVIGRLSKGFRQRVGLAQALVAAPDLLLLDEPTNGLDPFQIIEARRMIAAAAGGRAVVLSTHILQEVAALCSRVVYLHEGRLVELQIPRRGQFLEVRFVSADSDAVLNAVRALDPHIGIERLATDGHARHRAVFDLARAGATPAALLRVVATMAELESAIEPTLDIERALSAALAAHTATATTR